MRISHYRKAIKLATLSPVNVILDRFVPHPLVADCELKLTVLAFNLEVINVVPQVPSTVIFVVRDPTYVCRCPRNVFL